MRIPFTFVYEISYKGYRWTQHTIDIAIGATPSRRGPHGTPQERAETSLHKFIHKNYTFNPNFHVRNVQLVTGVVEK